MKKLLIYFSLIILSNTLNFSQVKIKIIVTSNKVDSTQKVFIAGNRSELGNWNPGLISFEKLNDTSWAKKFLFEKNSILEFKFTKGSWGNEALNENGSIPGNETLKVLNDTIIYEKINNWKDSRVNLKSQITGNVHYRKNFNGKDILPRDIIVWLPPSYDSLSNKKYPVLYMQDGQNVFDPGTSSFGVDWQIDETTDSLIKIKAIEEIIVVGIYNTYQRGSEYNQTDLGYAYMRFIVKELKPFIDSTYHTLPDRKNTAVGGSSSGGLISFMMLWEYPDIFSKAACISPAFKISDIDFVSSVKNYSGNKKDIKIYIDNGGVGLEEELQPGIDEMLIALKDKGYMENQDLLWVKDSSAEHDEAAWAKRVYRFLEFFFPCSE